jgi:hypothetical protein
MAKRKNSKALALQRRHPRKKRKNPAAAMVASSALPGPSPLMDAFFPLAAGFIVSFTLPQDPGPYPRQQLNDSKTIDLVKDRDFSEG